MKKIKTLRNPRDSISFFFFYCRSIILHYSIIHKQIMFRISVECTNKKYYVCFLWRLTLVLNFQNLFDENSENLPKRNSQKARSKGHKNSKSSKFRQEANYDYEGYEDDFEEQPVKRKHKKMRKYQEIENERGEEEYVDDEEEEEEEEEEEVKEEEEEEEVEEERVGEGKPRGLSEADLDIEMVSYWQL